MIYLIVETLNIRNLINSNVFWMIISIIELVIIIILLRKRIFRKKIKSTEFSDFEITQASKIELDMNNIINSINKSKGLYKELSNKCHPDRFVGSLKQDISEKIFKEISKNRNDYNMLVQLKERAKIELEIEF